MVQRDAGSHTSDYLAVYRSHFANKMDMSVFGNPTPRKLPKAPKRIRVSSYESSLRSFNLTGHFRVTGGRVSRRHKPLRQRANIASKAKSTASSSSRQQSPEI